MYQTSQIVFCSIDSFLPLLGKVYPGFDDFLATLEERHIPVVWLTQRTRAQLDEPIRRLQQRHPFIAEDGCGAYLPEGYFHLRPDKKTIRLGRFMCIPAAQAQPTAREALEALSKDTEVPVVPLHSLSPRELVQNVGLPAREADLLRLRDFDELFFFAGASEEDQAKFMAVARERHLSLRPRRTFWSLAVGGDVAACIRQLGKLYERALRSHPTHVAIAPADAISTLLPACDRAIVVQEKEDEPQSSYHEYHKKIVSLSRSKPDFWNAVYQNIVEKS